MGRIIAFHIAEAQNEVVGMRFSPDAENTTVLVDSAGEGGYGWRHEPENGKEVWEVEAAPIEGGKERVRNQNCHLSGFLHPPSNWLIKR